MKYCLPLMLEAKAHILEELEIRASEYDLFEVWLDYIEDLDLPFIRKIASKYTDKLIFLFRRDKQGAIRLGREKRKEILNSLNGSKVYLDLDINSQREELEHVRRNGLELALIASYHNYDKTPDDPQLGDIVTRMDLLRPTVYKLSTMCLKEFDAIRILRLGLRLKARGNRFIALGMGEYGAATRIFGALWGNEWSFAPVLAGQRSAPGQFTRRELEQIFKLIERK